MTETSSIGNEKDNNTLTRILSTNHCGLVSRKYESVHTGDEFIRLIKNPSTCDSRLTVISLYSEVYTRVSVVCSNNHHHILICNHDKEGLRSLIGL